MEVRPVSFARLTDVDASAATAAVFVNIGSALTVRTLDNVAPSHTVISFSLGPNPMYVKVEETPEQIFDLSRAGWTALPEEQTSPQLHQGQAAVGQIKASLA